MLIRIRQLLSVAFLDVKAFGCDALLRTVVGQSKQPAGGFDAVNFRGGRAVKREIGAGADAPFQTLSS